jgi:hypothetical protein
MLLHRLYEKAIRNSPFKDGTDGKHRWDVAKLQYADMIVRYNPFLTEDQVPKLKAAGLLPAAGVDSIFPVGIVTGE